MVEQYCFLTSTDDVITYIQWSVHHCSPEQSYFKIYDEDFKTLKSNVNLSI